MKLTPIPLLLGSSLLLLLSGCDSKSDSQDIKTSGMRADFKVIADGSGSSDIDARIFVGSGGLNSTLVNLEGGDNLTAEHDGVTKTLNEQHGTFGNIRYTESFNSDQGAFIISLNRSGGVSAPNSTVTLPTAFDIDTPAQDAQIPFSSDIDLSWSPSGFASELEVSFEYDCQPGSNGIGRFGLQDLGAASLSAATISSSLNSALQSGSNCTVNLIMNRVNNGTVDAAFGEGGTIVGMQQREVSFILLGD